ncbi:hypothetical protein ASPZODRAFT_14554 [Penicilliopsis zonata CBS 506.65]|uniref:Uncharacterized protein n=1 Tax=Penicilliopsis zonata CBS 506.65 TaxID=1073090 RepID=A0A1L9SMS8_9EURO|nr:hypothetical protein ASPZODRAFT_14554 [Penicilliopsis zonata CBS 506.65]OJJ48416.1 hypothetical protein ASPZODRAFT_14554 [Penicilliopsis zonata CBS 506.65]
MLATTTVVAIAVGCAAVFMISTAVGTVVWLRVRHDRLAREIRYAGQGPYARSIRGFQADTVTSLSREEGSALRQYGQLPFGRPTEWGLLASRESLSGPGKTGSDTVSMIERARSLRKSLSLSKSSQRPKALPKIPRINSLATLEENIRDTLTRISTEREEIPLSAIEGVMELPAETTPRQTPEMEEDRFCRDACCRPISQAWPVSHKNPLSLNPVTKSVPNVFDNSPARIRAGSITTQTAGIVPDRPIPPPPPAVTLPNRFLSKNDSIMHLSSMSLDTADADSSILDDNFRVSLSEIAEFTSPHLPPCPTFIPFSAYDVGLHDRGRKSYTSSTGPTFPGYSSSDTRRMESENTSPRRSLTARHPGYSTERATAPPRRSESLSSSPSKRHNSSIWGPQGMEPPPYSNLPAHHLNLADPNMLVSSQGHMAQRYSMFESHHDPFLNGVSPRTQGVSASRTPSFTTPEGSLPRPSDFSGRSPLYSAMKGNPGTRKGHRRQNCVRISIHPPVSFGRPVFSPMAEEPEEVEELETHHHSAVSSISGPVSVSSISPISPPSKHNSQHDTHSLTQFNETSQALCRDPPRKRKHARTDSTDSTFGAENDNTVLPALCTSLPTATSHSLSRTPSPEKPVPFWAIPSSKPRASVQSDNKSSDGSPRRSLIKGPRSQPGKSPISAARNSVHRTSIPVPLGETSVSVTSSPNTPSSRLPLATGPHSRDFRRSVETSGPADQEISPARYSRSRSVRESHGGSMQPRNNTNTVTIWEDPDSFGSPSHQQRMSLEFGGGRAGFISPHKSVESRRLSRMHSERGAPRQGLTTPQRQTIGLGLGVGTPASLYDRDGFLKE